MRIGLFGLVIFAIHQDQDITPKNVKAYDFHDRIYNDSEKMFVEWDVANQEFEAINKKLRIDLLTIKKNLLKLRNEDTSKVDQDITNLKNNLANDTIKYSISIALNKDGPYITIANVDCTTSFKDDRKAPFWIWAKDFSKHFSQINPLSKIKPDISLNSDRLATLMDELSKFKELKTDQEEKADIESQISLLSQKIDKTDLLKKIGDKKNILQNDIKKIDSMIDELRQSINKQTYRFFFFKTGDMNADISKLIQIVDKELSDQNANNLQAIQSKKKTIKEIELKSSGLGEFAKKLLKTLEEKQAKEKEKKEADEEERNIDSIVQAKTQEQANKKTTLEKLLKDGDFKRKKILNEVKSALKSMDENEILASINRDLNNLELRDMAQTRLHVHQSLKDVYKSTSVMLGEINQIINTITPILADTFNTNKEKACVQLEPHVKRLSLKIKELAGKTEEINSFVSGMPCHIKVTATKKGMPSKDSDQLQAAAVSNLFDFNKLNNFCYVVIFSIIILYLISVSKKKQLFLRKIAGIDALDEAIGRGVEMGRPIFYLTGRGSLVDFNHPTISISTLSATMILGQVAKKIAKFEAKLIVPHTDVMVMSVCQEITKQAYIVEGKPDSYRDDINFYLTDDQFAYTAAVDGLMTREKPSACIYMGYYYAEALLLAETGAEQGAIQIAGTDAEFQMPFFVAACDYTLIGEELYAAGAYLSKDPLQTATLRGQDIGKAFILIMILGLTILVTLGAIFRADDLFSNMIDLIRSF